MKYAIVEDDKRDAEILRGYIERYATETDTKCLVSVFFDAYAFLEYKPEYDCVFMDIDLPLLSGINCAKKLRTIDPDVPLIFATSFAQYALKGYGVDAFDYLVKPYSYECFCLTMAKLRKYHNQTKDEGIILHNADGMVRVSVNSIVYVEVNKHRLIYHTDSGVINVWGTMSVADEKLASYKNFAKCSVSFLVNMRYVKAVEGNYVIVKGDRLKISRAKKKSFLGALNVLMSDGGSAYGAY